MTDAAVSAKEVARWIAALGSAALGTLAIGLLAPWVPLRVGESTSAAILSFAAAFAWVSSETLLVGALTPALGPRSLWAPAVLALALVAVAMLGPPPSIWATSAVALLLLGAGSSLGAIVGRRVEHAGYLGVVAYVSSIADLTSVLHESGPSARILESAPTLAVLAVGAPMLGTADVSPILGVGDVTFVALYLAAAARHRLPWRRTLVALSLALAVTFAALLLLAQPIPALPFLGLAMVLAHRETWLPPAHERRQALAGVVVATLVVAVAPLAPRSPARASAGSRRRPSVATTRWSVRSAPMKTRRLGELDARVLGGSDGEGGGEGPVIVLFHGYGAPGDDLVGLHRGVDLGRTMRFVFPEAPHPLGGGFDFSAFGYGAPRAWWHIDLAALEEAIATGAHRDLTRDVPEGLADARARAASMLSAIESELRPSHVILGGFSQGAMLATSLTLETELRVDGLVCFSGTYLAEDVWKPRMAKRVGLPVLLTHGTHDPLLPHALAEKLATDMKEAGMRAELVSFRGQHQIPPVALARFERFVRGLTTPQE